MQIYTIIWSDATIVAIFFTSASVHMFGIQMPKYA